MHCTASKPVDKTFDEPLDNQSLQTEWKSAPLAKVQLCEYDNQTLEAFVVASCAKFDWPVRIFHCWLLRTDCETGCSTICASARER